MNDSDLPYSQACENNKAPILSVLNQAFANCRQVLEIGSGTGQHAVYFASQLAHLCWHSSDQPCNLPALAERIRRAALANLPPPLALDISGNSVSAQRFDGIFRGLAGIREISHIMMTKNMFFMKFIISPFTHFQTDAPSTVCFIWEQT